MLYIALPAGNHGAGVRGDNLSSALAALTPTTRLNSSAQLPKFVPGTLVQQAGPSFRPWPRLAAPRQIGHAIFDFDIAATRALGQLEHVSDGFDLFVTASRWCERVLRDAGVRDVVTIPCGVNSQLFTPERAIKLRYPNSFVIFSGGRFGLQKAHDVVLKATKTLAERHSDVFLLAAWTEPGRGEFKSMKASPYYPPIFDGRYKNPEDMMSQWIVESTFDPERIELVPPRAHVDMATVYGDSDVGLFPNRCEGDTNLMLMEYMACGRAAIATDFSGHRDIVDEQICLPLRTGKLASYVRYDKPVACWREPELEEVIETLEYAYQNRDHIASLGQAAAAVMQQEWTWERAACRLLKVVNSV